MIKYKFRKNALQEAAFQSHVSPYNWQILANALGGFMGNWEDKESYLNASEYSLTMWMGKTAEKLSSLPVGTVVAANKEILEPYPTWAVFFVSSFSRSLRDMGSFTSIMRVRDMAPTSKTEALDFANINFAETILYRYKNQLPFVITNWTNDIIQERHNAHS